MAGRLVFHIGLAKTGTTSLQHFCHRQRRWLAWQGLLYPRSQLGRHRSHSPLVASYIAHRPEGPSVALRWAPRFEAVRALAAEIEASACARALVSSEHFSLHFERAEARKLCADFARFDPVVLLVVRDPYDRFRASYNTHVTAGGVLSLDDYARATLLGDTRHMSMSACARIWRDAFGAERVEIVDYDAETDAVAGVLRRCGLTALPQASVGIRRRASLGFDALETLRQANAVLAARQSPSDRASLGGWLQHAAFSIRCRRRLEREDRSIASTIWPVDPQTLAALDTFAERDRLWLKEVCGVDLSMSGRDRIALRDESEGTDRRQQAQQLVDHATRGLWGASRVIVRLGRAVPMAQVRTTRPTL